MRYSTIAGAAMLAPAAFASPLNARQAGVPTCNPNNVRSLGAQKPKSTGFCTNWFKTTTTKHVAPVTVTGLTEPQISNLCSCILAPSYVSGRPLTSLEPTSTQAPSSSTAPVTSSTAAASSTTTPAITSTSTSSSASATATGCVNGDTAAGTDGAIFTKSCASGLDGATGQSFSAASAAVCQTKCTGTCAGFVYTPASRSCVLYTSVDGTFDNEGSSAFVYKSGRGSSSSSTSSAASSSSSMSSSASSSSSAVSSSTTSASSGAPSVFNIYIASASSATASGTMLRASGTIYPAGIYPSPTAAVSKRQAAACVAGAYTSNGQTFNKVCGQTFVTTNTGNVVLGTDSTGTVPNPNPEQPDADDKVTTLNGCIDFCAKKGSTSGVQNCKAVSFDETNTASTGCTLYKTADTTATTGAVAATSKDIAYLYNEVPAGVFTIDSRTGYVYSNDTSGNALCGAPQDRAIAIDSTKAGQTKAFNVKTGDVFIAPIDAASCIPISCTVDSALRLSCFYNNANIYLGKPYLDPTSNMANNVLVDQSLRLTAGSQGPISMYIAAASPSASSSSVVSSPADSSLFTTSDLLTAPKTTADHSFVAATSGGAINETFVLDTTVGTASVTLFKDVFAYAKDTYRFTASTTLGNGKLIPGVSCIVQFGLDVSQTGTRNYGANVVTLDTTFPGSFDFVFEGSFPNTRTASASFDITCTSTSAITIPITVSDVKLVANPSAPVRANYEITVSETAYATTPNAYIQFYSGNGTLIPDGTNPSTSTAVSSNTGSAITILYVGQSLSNQAAAIKACAAQAGATASSPNKMFEVYFDTSDSFWKCITFSSKSLPSKNLFAAKFATVAASANPVYGYYLSNILPYSA